MFRFERLKKKIAVVANIMLVMQAAFVGGIILPQKAAASTDNLVGWDFPSDPDDAVADSGIAANQTKTITTIGSNVATFDTTGATTNSARATGWDDGSDSKYWQVELSTEGYEDIALSSKQRSSDSGPKDFKVQYMVGILGSWTDVAGGNVTVANDYTTGAISSLSLPQEVEDQASVSVRWIMTSNTAVDGGDVSSAGASNIDDIVLTGNEMDQTPPDAPTVTLLDPINNANQNAVTITGIGEPNTMANYEISDGTNVSSGDGAVDGSGNISIIGISVSTLSDGTLTASVTLTDLAGNTGIAGIGTATKDTVSPDVAIDSLLPTNDTTPTITGTVDDNSAIIQISVNGNDYVGSNFLDGTWSADVTDELSEGIYEVVATGTDSVGNVGTDTTNDELTIDDGNLPDADMSNLPDPVTTQTGINISVGGTGVVAYKYDLDFDGYTGAIPVSTPIVSLGLSEGDHNISVVGIDALGNEEDGLDADTYSWTIDLTTPGAPTADYTNLFNTWYVNGDNQGSLSIGGTGEPGTVVSYVITDSASGSVSNLNAGVVDFGGDFEVNGIDASILAEGALVLSVTLTDAAGNTSTPALIGGAIKDTTTPVIIVNSLTTNNLFPVLTGTINDGTSDIQVSVGGNTYLAANNGDDTWTAVVTDELVGNSVYNVTVSATDAAGNTGNDSTDNELTIDTTNPVPTITSLSWPGPTNDNPIIVSINFSEDVTGFTEEDLTIGNGTINTGTFAQISPSSYQVEIIPTSNGLVTVDLEAALSFDTAGNGNDTAEQLAIEFDAELPSVDAGEDAVANAQITQTGTANDSNGIDAVLWSQVSGPLGGTLTFGSDDQLETTIEADVDGVYEVSLSVTDGAGNENADSFFLIWDTIDPSVAVDPILTNDPIPTLTGTFADGLSGVSAVNVTVDGNTYSVLLNFGNDTWSAEVTNPLADSFFDVFAEVTDAAGNTGTDATSDELEVDTIGPDIGELFPVPNPTNLNMPGYTFTSDEAGVISYGGDCSSVTPNAVFGLNSVTFGLLADGLHDNCTVQVTDTAGNPSNLLNVSAFTVDTVVPSVVLSTISLTPTNVSPIPVTAELSEDVLGFDVTDITVGNGTAGNFIALDGNIYTFDVTPIADGLVTLDVLAGTSIDAATNPNTASNQIAVTYDAMDPTAPGVTSDLVNAANQSGVLVQISGEADTGANISIEDSATILTGTVTLDGTGNFLGLLNMSTLLDETLTIKVTLTDDAGNTSGETAITVEKDTVAPSAPTITLTGPINNTNETNVSITGTGETNADITYSIDDTNSATPAVTGTGTVSGLGAISLTGIDVSSLDNETLTASVTLTDTVGNAGSAGTDTATKDTIPPEFVVTVAPAIATQANNIVTIEVTPSEELMEKSAIGVSGKSGQEAHVLGPTYELEVTVNEIGIPDVYLVPADADGKYIFTHQITSTGEKNVVVSVKGTDKAGNDGVGEGEFGIDNFTPAVTGLTASALNGKVILSWVNPTNSDFAGVRILRNGTEITNGLTKAQTYTDTTVKNGATYGYEVYPYDNSGNKGEKSEVSATPPIPQVAVNNQAAPAKEAIKKETPKEEIKAAVTENKPTEENKKDTQVKDQKKFPAWGIVFLLILAGIGAYLFYSQRPELNSSKKK